MKKTNPEVTIIEIFVYETQPEIINLNSLRVVTLLQSHAHMNKIISKMYK